MASRSNTALTLAKGAQHISKRLIASYVVDWIFILGIAGIGGGFNKVKNSNKRPFSLQDPSLSYPNKPDTVTPTVLAIVSLVAPAVITLVVSLLFVPGPTATRSTSTALKWRRKLWEWNTAWMGLGLGLASAFMITEGLKDLAGKPRPHAIAVCNPDLSAESIARYRVGGLGQSFDITGATPILVDWRICQQQDPHTLRDNFASWPSGHSSFSSAGMVYLTLFLCAKLGVAIPLLRPTLKNQESVSTFDEELTSNNGAEVKSSSLSIDKFPQRNQTAAPPVYLLLLTVYLPIGTAAFICVSRWFDYHHHGIDIFTGALIGTFTSYFSFRWYHMPLGHAGWSWGARSRQRAFWLGIGREGYVGNEGWESKSHAMNDRDLENGTGHVEAAHKVTGPGLPDSYEHGGTGNQHGNLHQESSTSTAA